MSELAEEIDNEDVDLTETTEPEAVEDEEVEVAEVAEADEAEETEADGGETEAEEEEESVVVTIAGESPPQEDEERGRTARPWVRELRKQSRELSKQNREQKQIIKELEAKLEAMGGEDQSDSHPPARPTLEECNWNEELHAKRTDEWYKETAKHREAEAAQKAELQAAEKEWNRKLERYQSNKATLKVPDFDLAELSVQNVLDETQQGLIISKAKNPELVVYALGKNPEKAEELSSIKDYVDFTVAMVRLEDSLSVTTRKKSPKPERALSGTARTSGSVNNTIEKLRKEAEKTNDLTKVLQYRRQSRS